ncbi:MAG: hypothetical protein O7G85_08930 [Planctomycetota bacterium]|nr:hypothetical protein [Planctomycetota bacterium]
MSRPVTTYDNRGLTWECRLALWLPGPAIVGALIIASTLIGAQLIIHWFLDLYVHRLAVLLMLMIAYIMMCPVFFAHRMALERKQFGFDVPVSGRKEMEAWVLSCPLDKIRSSRVAGAVGVLAFLGMDLGIAYFEGAQFPGFLMRFHVATITIFAYVMIGWLMGRAIYFSFSRHNDMPLPLVSDVDLLHLDTIYAIGRSGLRVALLWLIGMSIGSLFFLKSGLGLWGVFPAFGLGLVLGLVMLLKPARKVRNLIHEAKGEELAKLEPQLKQARDAALKKDSTHGKLTDLLAYQAKIKSTPEWPFDSSTLVRFGLYLLIPVISMIAGAFVERVIDGMLD